MTAASSLPRLLLATGNPSKLRLFTHLTDGLAVGVFPRELDARPAVTEGGRTVAENACRKAKAYYDCSGIPALSGDSGLLLLDLPPDDPQQPGVRIRRIVRGEDTTDQEMLAYYMDLARRHGGRMRAAYQNALCLYAGPDKQWMYIDSPEECAREAFYLTDRPCALRRPGWPLDSLSLDIGTGVYFLERAADPAADDAALRETASRYRPWLEVSLRALERLTASRRRIP